MDGTSKKQIELCCCYAREDQELLLAFEKQLKPLVRRGSLRVWSDREINGGMKWESEIKKHLNAAQIILLFVSPDFMASDYCYGKEMIQAMERHKRGEACVIPIILRPTLWQKAPFGELQVLPTNAEPVTSHHWHTPDDAFLDVIKGIEKQVEALLAQSPTPLSPPDDAFFGGLENAEQKGEGPLAQPSTPLSLHPPMKKARRAFLIATGTGIAALSSYEIVSFFHARQANVSNANTHHTFATSTAPVNTYDAYVSQGGIMFGFNAQHTRTNPYEHILTPGNVSHLQMKWSYLTQNKIDSSAPVVANGIVYVGSRDHKLYAIDAVTGQLKWDKPAITGGPIYSSPAVVNGIVYVGSDDHKLYAFDALTGRAKWDMPAITNGPIWSSPTVSNGVIYVGSQDNYLHAFDASTGQPKDGWPAFGGDFLDSSPAVANGVVYVGSNDHKLYAFDASTGRPKDGWPAHTQGVINSSPAVSNGVVYIGSHDGYLYAFDASTGQPKHGWPVQTGAIHDSSSAVANGIVYIGSFNGSLYAFDASTGQPKDGWPVSTNGPIYSSPTVANGIVYVGSQGQGLFAFHALTGQQLCNRLATHDIICSPVVANGLVYVGSWDNYLYAFALPHE